MTLPNVKVRNVISASSGNPIANQFIIYTDDGRFFQSYDSIIAFRDNSGQIYLDERTWDYSNTTGRYRNQFLGLNKRQTEREIKVGKIKLADLNSK
jgi:hypothetical protein